MAATALQISSSASRMGSPASASVVLVDPFPLVRAGIAGLIRQRPNLRVLAEAETADDALRLIRESRRRGRVIVMVSMGLSGEHDAEWLITSLREEYPSFVLLAFGPAAEAVDISRILFVGADGFVDAKVHPEEFLAALHDALDGQLVLAGVSADRLGPVVAGVTESEPALPPRVLTDREREVLAAAAEGLTARQIGERLSVGERTVSTHLANVYKKLGVNGRIAALNWAARAGLVDVAWPSA